MAYTEGHCKEKQKPGGCTLHNLQCGYPACDRKEVQCAAEAHEIPAVHPDQAREELWGLLMPMAIIRELTGTQHQDGYATVEAVRSALNVQPKGMGGCIACEMRDAAIGQPPSQDVAPEFLAWLDSKSRSAGVAANEAWNAGVAWARTQAAPTQAAQDLLAERQRQISVEGWTTHHDDRHRDGSLAAAASCYALAGSGRGWRGDAKVLPMPPGWPWAEEWWKPSEDCRRDLIKAGALILAEIERMDRLEEARKVNPHA